MNIIPFWYTYRHLYFINENVYVLLEFYPQKMLYIGAF